MDARSLHLIEKSDSVCKTSQHAVAETWGRCSLYIHAEGDAGRDADMLEFSVIVLVYD